ncbi:T9SS type A sorting domain-containing protein [Taibaiella soli]|uniref:Secretion system C-terminal sorting domain-containing protein n=1 Tax=Taibaiella soli TaxID=1649169 RepID=A0A2W2BM46_9BACT|nr:T9SS type A sorting domain-containing protein [Taibaiella soli]PZF74516.1 hypothetical protein DN068_02775 [Taibaiella soli]
MKLLSILLCAVSASAFAQQKTNDFYSRVTSQLSPQLKEILVKQMATHGLNKTTLDKQRLVAYSLRDFQNNVANDSMYFGYSGNRGSSFANCMENMEGRNGRYSKPDTLWSFFGGGLSFDARYTYDSHDSLLSVYYVGIHSRVVYTRDNAGNAIITEAFDSTGNQITHTATYSAYDNQNRKILDSTDQSNKTNYAYGQGVDSSIHYTWATATAAWEQAYMALDIYNNAGTPTVHYQFSPAGSNAWDSAFRVSYTYNANGFLTLALTSIYDDLNNSWRDVNKEIFDYTGNHPFYSYYETLENTPSGWVGDNKFACQTNNAGNWDVFYGFAWNNTTNVWDTSRRINFTYNNLDLISTLETYRYDNTIGSFEANPFQLETYYYKTYIVPNAVDVIHAVAAEISAYPNPVSGNLHIGGNIGNQDVSMQIISITGVRLFNASGNWQSMNKDIDMSGFANGVYYLLIKDGNGNKIAAKQIIKA